MPFTVEDGSGVEDANAYGLVAECDTYQEERGRTAWASLGETAKQGYIVEGSTYLDTTFVPIGDIKSTEQGLLWPRVNAVDRQGRYYDDQVPRRWKEACFELAWLARSGPLIASETEAAIKKVKAGPVEVEFMDGNKVQEGDKFAWVNRLVAGLTKGQAGGPNVSLLKA